MFSAPYSQKFLGAAPKSPSRPFFEIYIPWPPQRLDEPLHSATDGKNGKEIKSKLSYHRALEILANSLYHLVDAYPRYTTRMERYWPFPWPHVHRNELSVLLSKTRLACAPRLSKIDSNHEYLSYGSRKRNRIQSWYRKDNRHIRRIIPWTIPFAY